MFEQILDVYIMQTLSTAEPSCILITFPFRHNFLFSLALKTFPLVCLLIFLCMNTSELFTAGCVNPLSRCSDTPISTDFLSTEDPSGWTGAVSRPSLLSFWDLLCFSLQSDPWLYRPCVFSFLGYSLLMQ